VCEKKAFLLRTDPALLDALQRWADDDLRADSLHRFLQLLIFQWPKHCFEANLCQLHHCLIGVTENGLLRRRVGEFANEHDRSADVVEALDNCARDVGIVQ